MPSTPTGPTSEARERDRAIGREDGRSPDEVIAAIDSSGWAVDPVQHGMTAAAT